MYQGDEDIYRALQAGAATYLLKDALTDELVCVVRQVYAGGHPLPPNVAKLLAARETRPMLTARETEVMKLLAKGMRNKEIGALLNISEETAKVHVRNILAKFGVNDRAAAIHVAAQRGVIHMDDR